MILPGGWVLGSWRGGRGSTPPVRLSPPPAATKDPPAVKMYRQKLLAGQHVEPDWSAPSEAGKKRPSKTHTAGQIVTSTQDLAKRFGGEKFLPLGSHDSASPPPPEAPTPVEPKKPTGRIARIAEYGDVQLMSLSELKELAAGEEIDLSGVRNKEQALQRVQEWVEADPLTAAQ